MPNCRNMIVLLSGFRLSTKTIVLRLLLAIPAITATQRVSILSVCVSPRLRDHIRASSPVSRVLRPGTIYSPEAAEPSLGPETTGHNTIVVVDDVDASQTSVGVPNARAMLSKMKGAFDRLVRRVDVPLSTAARTPPTFFSCLPHCFWTDSRKLFSCFLFCSLNCGAPSITDLSRWSFAWLLL
ncbi:hypothetical protein L596_002023 [Steinernema carpocapsae]|uniref:Uncharacterized protein n=1 Tax=Steinernema carpocapsae TaxID=34508 RepID=A0A4U8UNB4_STECR|nr:hypothetical protein L596_002023 [Steinernema carpocapsae]